MEKLAKLVFEGIPTGYELRFLVDMGIVLAAGFAIGAERESRGKPAGISTHCLVNCKIDYNFQNYCATCCYKLPKELLRCPDCRQF